MDGTLRIGFTPRSPAAISTRSNPRKNSAANALQIFSASPRMWAGDPRVSPKSTPRPFARVAKLSASARSSFTQLFDHLAAQQPMLRTRSIQAFHDELVRGIALGLISWSSTRPCGDCRPDQPRGLRWESSSSGEESAAHFAPHFAKTPQAGTRSAHVWKNRRHVERAARSEVARASTPRIFLPRL